MLPGSCPVALVGVPLGKLQLQSLMLVPVLLSVKVIQSPTHIIVSEGVNEATKVVTVHGDVTSKVSVTTHPVVLVICTQ